MVLNRGIINETTNNNKNFNSITILCTINSQIKFFGIQYRR